ncbi:MAG: FAD-dependent oxidoreductase [bacterium]
MAKTTPENFDVIVVGGGPSGLVAATSAARAGAGVLLLESGGCLGGTGTASMVAQFHSFFHNDAQVVRGIPGELTERIQEAGGAEGFQEYVMAEASPSGVGLPLKVFPFNPEIAKIVMDEMVTESGARVLFHTQLVEVVKQGGRLAGVEVQGINSRRALSAKVIVDATGDAIVSKKAGCQVRGEEEDFRRARMPLTLAFRLTNVDVPRMRALPREEKQRLVKKGLERGELFWESLAIFKPPGTTDGISIMSRIVECDALNDDERSKAEITGRQQIKKIVNFMRQEVPGFENATLAGIASRAGVRETRTVVGRYTLTDEDIFQTHTFEDAIALGSGPYDIHDHKGPGLALRMPPKPFQIPLRCLLPAQQEGLIVTGRAISATRGAMSTIRHQGTVMALGQAAGAIAAVATQQGILPHEVGHEDVQKVLREQGAVLAEGEIY